MPNLNQLILTGADYKLLIDVPNPITGGFQSFVIKTAESLSWDIAQEDETVHAIGTIYPIAEKSNAKTYKGTLVLQMGEINAILLITGLNDATQLKGCTLAITAIQGGVARVFNNVNFNTERNTVRAKDKVTPVTMDWKGLGVNVA